MPVHVGDVYIVQSARADKAQALKILEEAAEVFSAWERFVCCDDKAMRSALEFYLRQEVADLITASCGMLAGLGFHDASEALEFCKLYNEERGRMVV